MSNRHKNQDSPIDALKSESARQRWDLFHRAIAHAKHSNQASMAEADSRGSDAENVEPVLSVVR